ncbi:36808_t:CDS:2, partial [Racocetra persica]
MPFAQLLTNDESLSQETEKVQKQEICKQKKEERDHMKMEQQCIREAKRIEKKNAKKV